MNSCGPWVSLVFAAGMACGMVVLGLAVWVGTMVGREKIDGR